jgi:hypothetical protein
MAASPVYALGVKVLNVLTGTMRVFVDGVGPQGAMVPLSGLVALTAVNAQVLNTSALAASGTLTAANVTGGLDTVYLTMTGAFGGAANIQLPTAAAILALLPNYQVGTSYQLRVINPSGQTLTLTTNTGIALNAVYGSASIPTETFRDFVVTVASATTLTVQDVGSGSAVAE